MLGLGVLCSTQQRATSITHPEKVVTKLNEDIYLGVSSNIRYQLTVDWFLIGSCLPHTASYDHTFSAAAHKYHGLMSCILFGLLWEYLKITNYVLKNT